MFTSDFCPSTTVEIGNVGLVVGMKILVESCGTVGRENNVSMGGFLFLCFDLKDSNNRQTDSDGRKGMRAVR